MTFVGFSNIMVRSRQDLGNLGEMEDISPRSRRDLECHKRHGEISTISVQSRQSRQILGNLGEIEDISLRSHRDLESNKHHGEISARSLQSRRDLGKNFAREHLEMPPTAMNNFSNTLSFCWLEQFSFCYSNSNTN